MAKSPFAGVKTSARRTSLEDSFRNNIAKLPFERILPRPEDTRPINIDHVKALADSIAAVGLIQPIAVDVNGRLLAGGHRLAAIKHLKTSNETAFLEHFNEGIPIRRYDFDASLDEAQALAIEATENEKRRDYTPAEVRELADKLEAAGYHRSRGRARNGQKSVGPTLAIIVGKSQRTIERYLSNDESSSEPKPTDDGFKQQLKATIRSLKKLQTAAPNNSRQKKLQKEVLEMIGRLENELG